MGYNLLQKSGGRISLMRPPLTVIIIFLTRLRTTDYNLFMTEKMIIEAALQAGFERAVIVKTEDIPFNFAFRSFCEENVCGQYGANYSCPPDSGTCEELRNKIINRKTALVVQSVNKIADFSAGRIQWAKLRHCDFATELENKLKCSGVEGFMVGACGCTLCEPCAKVLDLPCKFPERRYSCMSAYCINVKELCEKCGLAYDCSPDLALFGMYVFD